MWPAGQEWRRPFPLAWLARLFAHACVACRCRQDWRRPLRFALLARLFALARVADHGRQACDAWNFNAGHDAARLAWARHAAAPGVAVADAGNLLPADGQRLGRHGDLGPAGWQRLGRHGATLVASDYGSDGADELDSHASAAAETNCEVGLARASAIAMARHWCWRVVVADPQECGGTAVAAARSPRRWCDMGVRPSVAACESWLWARATAVAADVGPGAPCRCCGNCRSGHWLFSRASHAAPRRRGDFRRHRPDRWSCIRVPGRSRAQSFADAEAVAFFGAAAAVAAAIGAAIAVHDARLTGTVAAPANGGSRCLGAVGGRCLHRGSTATAQQAKGIGAALSAATGTNAIKATLDVFARDERGSDHRQRDRTWG